MTPKTEVEVLDVRSLVAIARPFVQQIVEALNAKNAPEKTKFCTVEEAAAEMALHVSAVKRLIREGKLRWYRSGPRRMVERKSIEEWRP